ncbi:MAG TPA: class I adenylate-forming enzyme family protein [Devosiaceae bacterium]
MSSDVVLAQGVFATAESDPLRPALVTPQHALTYRQLRNQIINYALRLHSHGVDRTSCVALSLASPIPALTTIFALSLLGARWIVASESSLEQAQRLGITHRCIGAAEGGTPGPGLIYISPLWHSSPPGRSENLHFEGYASPDDVFMVAQSSGTTGMPKFMTISARMMKWGLGAFDTVFERASARARNPYPTLSPLFPVTTVGGSALCLCVLAKHGTVVFGHDYETWTANGTDIVAGSPAQAAAILDGLPVPPSPEVQSLLVFGSQIGRAFLQRALLFFDRVDNRYGSTEAWGATEKTLTSEDDDVDSAGSALPGVTVEIVDDDDVLLQSGTEGIVRVRAPMHVPGYMDDPEATARAFRGGWFYAGDLGLMSESGELYVTGRVDDRLNLGGTKINASFIDRVVGDFDGVADAMCFTEQGPSGIAMLSIVARATGDIDHAELARMIGTGIAKYAGGAETLGNLYFADSVPRNTNGKVVRRAALEAIRGIAPLRMNRVSDPGP